VDDEKRFTGSISDEYDLIRLVMPHFDELQSLVAQSVTDYPYSEPKPIKVLDLGCGSGRTAEALLTARQDVQLIALDNEEKMLRQAETRLQPFIQQGRCRLVLADALRYLEQQPENTLEIVASALTLHNMTQSYRADLHAQILRVLKAGGLFVNADKYAPQDDRERFEYLGVALNRFFDVFVPLGKFHQLREWVLHNVADQSPDHVMKEQDIITALHQLGFVNIQINHRRNLEALLVARKPRRPPS
jgi:ubiquinone/menaquinone biosynthesis C-methylase UbiE